MLIADALAAPGSWARDLLADGLRVGVGFVWLFAGARKLRSPAATLETVVHLIGGSEGLTRTVTRALPPVEIALGLVVIVGWHARATTLLSASVFFAFACLVARATIREALPKGGWGCFGPSRTEVDDAGPRVIARNLVLAILAVGAAA